MSAVDYELINELETAFNRINACGNDKIVSAVLTLAYAIAKDPEIEIEITREDDDQPELPWEGDYR